MAKRIELVGMKIGKLLVLERVGSDERRRALYRCQCDCGAIVIKTGSSLRHGFGSCGCAIVEKAKELHTKHGMTNTRLFRIWGGMRDRCNHSKHKDYPNYGERGIIVCDEWNNNFMNFYEWAMANGYRDDLSIDRIDVNGNYEPSNCRWATPKQQANNTRINAYYTYNGRTQSLKMWSEELGVRYSMVLHRHQAHPDWTFEQIFSPAFEEKTITYNGKTLTFMGWGKELGIPHQTIYNRYYRNPDASPEELLGTRDKRCKNNIIYNGKSQSMAAWSRELGISLSAIKNRRRAHPDWTPEQLFAPVDTRRIKKK